MVGGVDCRGEMVRSQLISGRIVKRELGEISEFWLR